MRQSRPITHDGRMLGVAAAHDRGWFFIATDSRVEELHGAVYRDACGPIPTLACQALRESAHQINGWWCGPDGPNRQAHTTSEIERIARIVLVRNSCGPRPIEAATTSEETRP